MPSLVYGELLKGVDWSSLSSSEQEYIINQDEMISKAIANILSIAPGSIKDTTSVKGFRKSYSKQKHIFHSEKINVGGISAHAIVNHRAFGKNGKITKAIFSSEIHYSSSSMANFRNKQSVTSDERARGYHANLRAGMKGLYDLSIHEMAHTFNQSKAIGVAPSVFSRMEESRADSFLKEIRGF